MPQFFLVEVEGSNPEDGVVFVEEEPGVADGIEVAHDVLAARWGVALGTHNGYLARLASGNVYNDDGMAVFPSRTGRVDKDIAGLDILDGAWLGFVVERVGTAHTVNATHVFLKGFARGTAIVLYLVAVDIAETDFAIAAFLPQVFCTQTHGYIGTLFVVAQEGLVYHTCTEELEIGLAASVEHYLCALFFQGQIAQVFSIATCWCLHAMVTERCRNLSYRASIPRIAGLADVICPDTANGKDDYEGENDRDKCLFHTFACI